MDAWGTDGCRQRRNEIAAEMRENAKTVSWFQKVRAAALAVKAGLAWSLNPADVFGSLVDEAIRRAEARGQRSESEQSINHQPSTINPPTRHLLYHVYPKRGNGVWQANVAELLARWELFDGRKIISVAVGPETDSADAVQAAFGRDEIEWIVAPNNKKLGEVPTFLEKLSRLQPTSDRDRGGPPPTSDVAFYAHTKGAAKHTLQSVAFRLWAKTMYAACLDDWDKVARFLRHWPLAGAFPKSAGHFAEPTPWHYSGTFFWMRLADVFALPDWSQVSRNYAGVEMWPGQRFPRKQASCLLQRGGGEMNLYDANYWTSKILPKLKPHPVTTDELLPTAVVIPCHNYGRYLAECLESVLAQTQPAAEILVVDDSSDDDTPDVAARFAGRGVRYLRVDHRSLHATKRAGFEATTSPAIVFLDADDVLAADYLASGLRLLADGVGLVSSPLQEFGVSDRFRTQDGFTPLEIERTNMIHTGSIARRTALQRSDAFGATLEAGAESHSDWWLWRQIVRDGWRVQHQPVAYRYRKHGASMMDARAKKPYVYFDYAGVASETLTLFVAVSDRPWAIDSLLEFLDRQTWPHSQVDLILARPLHYDETIDRKLAAWRHDYRTLRVVTVAAGRRGLADDDRRQPAVTAEVRKAVTTIYRSLQEAAPPANEYVWILEDDVRPPLDVAERLLRGFDRDAASVGAPYRSRYHGGYVQRDKSGVHFQRPADGVQVVGGNGFGCTIVRRSVLSRVEFRDEGDCDIDFHRQVPRDMVATCDWSCAAEHLESTR
jgi:glycosyltransferase involved in cell wall biosynthesis